MLQQHFLDIWKLHLCEVSTSGVPQNVDVVPEGSIPSLQSPKSVKTI